MSKTNALPRIAEERLAQLFQERLGYCIKPLRIRKGREEGALFDLSFELKDISPPRKIFVEVRSRLLSKDVEQFGRRLNQLKRAEPRAIGILVVPHLGAPGRDLLRKARINHADLDGVLFIRDPGLSIDLDPDQRSDLWSPFKINPFTDKASLVLRALFENPQQAQGVSEISRQAGLAKSWVSMVASELVQQGYVERRDAKLRLLSPEVILKDWSARYTWRANTIESFATAFEYEKLVSLVVGALSQEATGSWAFTLLAASSLVASHVQHNQVHVYLSPVARSGAVARLRKLLLLEPVQSGGQFHILTPYYSNSVFFGSRDIQGIRVVSDLQLYLDLLGYPLRGLEAAGMLLRTRLAPTLGLSAEAVRSLL